MEEIGGFNPEKEAFFANLERRHLKVTYDDVRIETRSGRDGPLPDVLDTSSNFSRRVPLKIPFSSAAMNSVTESDMAIAIAELGGIGVIHAAMTVEEQYEEVRRVKKHVNKLIEKPRSVQEDWTLERVMNWREEEGYDFTTFPVDDHDGFFSGVLTKNDFKFAESMSELVRDSMTPADQVTSSGPETTLEEAYEKMHAKKIGMLPLIQNGILRGLYLWSDVSRVVREHGSYNVDAQGRLMVAAAVPTRNEDFMERISQVQKYADAIVLDTANGDAFHIFGIIEDVKNKYPDLDIVAGNISTGLSARHLAEAGADAVKVGQGPGSICTTRAETGIGKPQVSAVYECAKALREDFPDVPVIADGGIKNNGDIAVALAAGAHSVMMGRMLAGTTESPVPIGQRADGSRYKEYWGMGSARGMQHASNRARYGIGKMVVPEGVDSKVPYVGDLKNVLGLMVEYLHASMRYQKTPNIEAIRKEMPLFQVTQSGLVENHPHDVEVVTQ